MVSKIRISSEASWVVSTCSWSLEITNWIFYVFKKILFSGLTKRKTIDDMLQLLSTHTNCNELWQVQICNAEELMTQYRLVILAWNRVVFDIYLFQTKKCHFSHPISKPIPVFLLAFRQKLCHKVTQIRAQTKKVFKRISNSHISISFSFIWNWNDINTFIHSHSSLENPTGPIPDQNRQSRCMARFQTKKAHELYLLGGTYQ